MQGCKATICMPVTTPGIKVDAVRRLGATVEMVGESYTETQSHAQARFDSFNGTWENIPKAPINSWHDAGITQGLWASCLIIDSPYTFSYLLL